MEGESILLESGERVIVAVPQGDPFVFNKPRLEFIKPKWTDDSAATQCLYCNSKFTQLRRKHHCRSCGRLFCSKCCNDKTAVLHLGMNELERTCIICKPILQLMNKAFSTDTKMKEEAAAGFQQLIEQMRNMQEILEMGGLHTLVWLCSVNSSLMQKHLVSALHTLATQVSLQKYLLQAGLVQALSSIMKGVNASDQLFTDCVSTFLILSNTEQSMRQANGGLASVLENITRVDELTKLLSLQTISRMSSLPMCHQLIMDRLTNITYLTSIAASHDLQVSTLSYTILGEISAGQNLVHKISLAEAELGCAYISKSLTGSNVELLCNVCCLLANIASVTETQVHLANIIPKLKDLLKDPSKAYYVHVVRALLNFSRFHQHSYSLMMYIPLVVSGLNAATDPGTQNISLHFLSNLLSQSADEASDHICRADGRIFLKKLMQTPKVAGCIAEVFDELTAAVCRPSKQHRKP